MSTIREELQWSSSLIDRLDAEILLTHVLNTSREYLMTHDKKTLPFISHLHYRRLVNKRKKGLPLAYLTGVKFFYGLPFLVNASTLIPRPETEHMVDLVLDNIQTTSPIPVTLIDVGTGTGCIPISILKHAPHTNAQVHCFAIDISKKALTVAKKNAARHDVNITFLHGNLLDPVLLLTQPKRVSSERIITANLPYLTEEQFQGEKSIQYEPKSALVAENNGLALYEQLLHQLSTTNHEWLATTCYMEIDPTQSNALQLLISKSFPRATINVYKDLSGRERIISLSL